MGIFHQLIRLLVAGITSSWRPLIHDRQIPCAPMNDGDVWF